MALLRKITIFFAKSKSLTLLVLFAFISFNIWSLNRQLSTDQIVRDSNNIRENFWSPDNENEGNSTPQPSTNNTYSSIVRPMLCNSCFPHHFRFILNNEDICSIRNGSESIRIIILIFSKHANFLQRDALRKTWLLASVQNTKNIRHAFLIGATYNKSLQVSLERENAIHRDVVQENFIDSYYNLTLKTVMALRWTKRYCSHADFMMKVDDDMFVNTVSLETALTQHESRLQRSVGGFCWLKERPIRHKESKWYMSYNMYPLKYYPDFCSGTGYVTSTLVAKKLYDISKNVPFFMLEDVYIGLCLNALGLSVTQIEGFNIDKIPLGCVYKRNRLITSHRLDPDNLTAVWRLKCDSFGLLSLLFQ